MTTKTHVRTSSLGIDHARRAVVSAPAPRSSHSDPAATRLSVSDPRVRILGLNTSASGAVLVRLASVADVELEVTLTTDRTVVGAQCATYSGQTRGNVPHSDRAVSLIVEAMSATACVLQLDCTADYIVPMTQRGDNNG